MQVNQNQIQRPSLITPLFDKELTPDNEFVAYIDCSTNASSVVHKKSVTSNSHNIEKSLKNKNYIRAIDNELIKNCPIFSLKESSSLIFVHSKESCFIFIQADIKQHKNYYKLHDNFSIFDEVSAIA